MKNDYSFAGKAIVFGVAIAITIVSAATIIAYWVRIGDDKLIQQIIRFCLTLMLMFLLVHRVRWARWITICLFGGGGVVVIGRGLDEVLLSPAGWLMVGQGLFYLSAAGLLLLPRSVSILFERH